MTNAHSGRYLYASDDADEEAEGHADGEQAAREYGDAMWRELRRRLADQPMPGDDDEARHVVAAVNVGRR